MLGSCGPGPSVTLKLVTTNWDGLISSSVPGMPRLPQVLFFKEFEMTVKYIANRAGDIALPWEPGLLEWLIAKYPHSGYEIKELTNV